ncbi:DUF1385 domain-containing protein [Candidatus Woesearchaeota archaeon]|nr:DUF1385 domain-containing protein [Candidatus Woesearchaeota archaeon]
MQTLGGQAVIEGVMIRNKDIVGIAVRCPDGKITTKRIAFRSWTTKNKFFGMPVIRGFLSFLEMIVLGIKALNYSASVALYEDEKVEKSGGPLSSIIVALSFIAGAALFVAVPIFLTTKIFNVDKEAFLFNLFAGGFRIAIFILYVYILSFSKDVRRVFSYHGAEHKVVNCYERGDNLQYTSIRRHSRIHKRCGTSFLLAVLFVAIVSFIFLDSTLLIFLDTVTIFHRIAFHLLILPLIMGVSYEIIKLAGKDNNFAEFIVQPGLWMQHITTKEPDEQQIEVAIAALNVVLS